MQYNRRNRLLRQARPLRGRSRAFLRAVHLNVRSLSMKPIIRSLIAGLAWGIIGAVIYRWAPYYVVAGILTTGPIIGVTVYMLSRWSYRTPLSIALWTVPSVYLAVALFGVVSGSLDGIARGQEIMLGDFFGALFGISVPSPFWLLFPLAFATHLWVRSGQTNPPEPGNVGNAI